MTNLDQSWDTSAEDFGQKVDLTVRIREILRNYPEGLSILKELIQNADDAGARTVRLCTAEPRLSQESIDSSPLSDLMSTPSLLAYNSAKFTSTDFRSIQQIGDSLKKSKTGTKTGRFGVGVNSTYHLTEVPMFVSGCKVVLFDPQAKFVPGINPANPGKMVDCSTENGRRLVTSLPNVFNPLKVWGSNLDGCEFNGTIFRFALRSEKQAEQSRLSNQSHSLEEMMALLKEMSSGASTMLLFLKNVENIEIFHWKANEKEPVMVHRTRLKNNSEKVREKRAFMLNASPSLSKPTAVDYFMDIDNDGIGTVEQGGQLSSSEKWIICNQFGGGNATIMAKDPRLAHMKLIPWAGVAARLNPMGKVDDGAAYCFLPLPVKTMLPVHVNGYFELSSNRRDVWWGDDMAGDGRTRADWNYSLVADIAAPCYCRLVVGSIRAQHVSSDTYETLFPQKSFSGPWEILAKQFYIGIRNYPILYSKTLEWVSPSVAILMEKYDEKLAEVLEKEKLPLVLFQKSEVQNALLERKICVRTSTPKLFRDHFSKRKNENGALEDKENKFLYAQCILKHCISDLNPSQYDHLSGCQLIPLANGSLGTFYSLTQVNLSHLQQLEDMGYTKLNCLHALRKSNGNMDGAIEILFSNSYDASSIVHGVDSYLVCDDDVAKLMERAAGTFVNLDLLTDIVIRKFFSLKDLRNAINIHIFSVDFMADLVSRAIPKEWRNVESAVWDPMHSDSLNPDRDWFKRLWRYIFTNIGESTNVIAEKYCIVPTNQDIVCILSPGASVLDSFGLDEEIINACISLDVRTFLLDTLPTDLVFPKQLRSYIHKGNRDGVIQAIETSIRRKNISKNDNGKSPFDDLSSERRSCLYNFLSCDKNGPISTASYQALRSFPIFRNYSNNSKNSNQFTALDESSDWYLLKDFTIKDELFMTSNFIVHEKENHGEIQLLLKLGVKQISHSAFFRDFVIPCLSDFDQDLCHEAVRNIFLRLPSLGEVDPDFFEELKEKKLVPSAMTSSLLAAKNLYDPEIPQLRALMDEDAFPHQSFCSPDFLTSMRKLGLQNSLTWDVVIECAKSIENEAKTQKDSEDKVKSRGKELLAFLDLNWKTYFPELVPKQKSTAKKFFSKMNSVLFEDPEKKRIKAEQQAERIKTLLNLKWIPVSTTSPNPILPWRDEFKHLSVAAPVEVILKEHMWFCSYSKRLLDDEIKSKELIRLFGWSSLVSFSDVAIQLRTIGERFHSLKESLSSDDEDQPFTLDTISQTISAELPRIYHVLNQVQSDTEIDTIRSILHERNWLWVGGLFVSSDHVAFTSSINAMPYLYTVPPDLACFRNLLSVFGVRKKFSSSDFCEVLQRMASQDNIADKRRIEIAVNLVQSLSDDVMKLQQMEIYAPSNEGLFKIASTMVYDDAPWLSKSLQEKKDFFFIHPKISNNVAEKVGAKSLRRHLLEDNSDVISFGDGIIHESFGQSESLTRRLKNIVEMYPEGPQQLSELVQNADDAKASIVRLVVSKKSHGTKSLLGQKLSSWQGPALMVYNDSTFSATDFQNLARIGQASKLEKLVTTGRFGLGFNSVFHWTDVPSFVSGDYLVFFDPHVKYVPGATNTSRGIKIRFSGTSLMDQFPDQLMPYCHFGNNMKNRFQGTLFRFPFRNDATASESEISSNQCNRNDAIDRLMEQFKIVIPKFLLFLRHVKKIEVYVEDCDDEMPQLLYYADVTSRKVLEGSSYSDRTMPRSNLEQLRSITSNGVFGVRNEEAASHWNSISSFITGPGTNPLSKEAFYSKLERTPTSQLPRTCHLVTIKFEDHTEVKKHNSERIDKRGNDVSMATEGNGHMAEEIIEAKERNTALFANDFVVNEDFSALGLIKTQRDEYLICTALGGGECRRMACQSDYRHMKFIPWGGVAAHLKRNGDPPSCVVGNAFCFLPLPAETGLPIHINGYFELSANRRDIWFGQDMTGDGEIRSKWNSALLKDVIAPLYTELLLSASHLLGPGRHYNQLWPIDVNGDVWKQVRDAVYDKSQNLPLLYSSLHGGKWLSANSAVVISDTDTNETKSNQEKASKLAKILLTEELDIVSIPSTLCKTLREQNCKHTEVSPAMVRSWFKRNIHHPSLGNPTDMLFLLKYCLEDIIESNDFTELIGLRFIPMCDGDPGVFTAKSDDSRSMYFVARHTEREILSSASQYFVDVWTKEDSINDFLRSEDLHAQMRISLLGGKEFVKLLSYIFPLEWERLPEVQWSKRVYEDDSEPLSLSWMTSLWKYIAGTKGRSSPDIKLFENSWQILPTLIGEEGRTLMKLTSNMAVVSPLKSSSTEDNIPKHISSILRDIGIRVVDIQVFDETSRSTILQKLDGFVQQPTLSGIIQAVIYSFAFDIDENELRKRIYLRFKNITDDKKVDLRKYFQSQRNMVSSPPGSDVVKFIRLMPIFPTYLQMNSDLNERSTELMDLAVKRYLPPSCADRTLLDCTFLNASSRSDHEFLIDLGVTTMESIVFYESYLIPLIMSEDISDSLRTAAVSNLLMNITNTSREHDNPSEWLERISNYSFMPNQCNELMKPRDLYDPESNDLANLLDDSMMPSEQFTGYGTLSCLRSLGLRTRLTCDGVLDCARNIESVASHEQDFSGLAGKNLRKRSLALLQYLDNDETMEELLRECTLKDNQDNNNQGSESSPKALVLRLDSHEGRFISELNEIKWLPVQIEKDENQNQDCLPPRRDSFYKCVSSPKTTRPKSEEWLCSWKMEILSINLRSKYLFESFGWDKTLTITVLASQLLALSNSWETSTSTQAFRQVLATVIPRCYELLHSHLDPASLEERDKMLTALQNEAWVWVGDRFVTSSQVAFDAPENARPYLFSLPQESRCFDELFKYCGVRETFEAKDYVKLTYDLSSKLGSSEADSRQLDLAIGMAKLLSRLPPEELSSVDMDKMFLPSRERKMYRANQMVFDDAPWLSTLITSQIKRSRHYVHEDVPNAVARILGAKSLRDVLSASQNGMVKIPCPKRNALAELFADRETTGGKATIEDCRVLLEILELAEMNNTKQVTFLMDYRPHKSESLLNPLLSQAQGPSLSVCFHDISIRVDDLIKSSSPSRYYSEALGGRGGSGGNGFPRYGRGVSSCFFLTDILQVLSGNQLLIFDPTGEFFYEGNMEAKSENNMTKSESQTEECSSDGSDIRPSVEKSPTARNYGITIDFMNQFPDQFEPFLSLPFGVKQSFLASSQLSQSTNGSSSGPLFRGTIFRIPLRTIDGPDSRICNRIFDKNSMLAMIDAFKKKAPSSFLFTYNLQYIGVDEWVETNNKPNPILHSRVSSSPITRRNHRDCMEKNTDWMKVGSKLTQLFKTTWAPVPSSYILQISSRKNHDETEIVDTFIVRSILAPGRLRAMACTEVLESLKLIPTVSLAVHIHQSGPGELAETPKLSVRQGSIFVGLDTCIKTGLPFIVNAPVFLHETKGNILLDKEDDRDLRQKYPSMRNVQIQSKQGHEPKILSVALYIWNREAISSAMNLIPQFFNNICDMVRQNKNNDPRHLYCFWPYYSRIRPSFKDLITHSVYEELGEENNEVFLTELGTFQSITQGYFASPKYPIPIGAAQYFQKNLDLFMVPQKIIEDLECFNINVKTLTPSLARKLLKQQSHHISRLGSNSSLLLELLLYCLGDLTTIDNFNTDRDAHYICKSELSGLSMIPLADGSIGSTGKALIVATQEQQEMFPSMKAKFISTFALSKLKLYLNKPGFLSAMSWSKFGPHVIADNISKILPSSWKGKDFVYWNPEENSGLSVDSGPSQLWLYQFWKEVNVWDSDTVELFSRWPLIPTQTGELASCGNLKYLSSFYPAGDDECLDNNLGENHRSLRKRYDNAKKNALSREAAEIRVEEEKYGKALKQNAMEQDDEYFISLGEEDDDSIEVADFDGDPKISTESDSIDEEEENSSDVENVDENINDGNPSNGIENAADNSASSHQIEVTQSSSNGHGTSIISGSSIKGLHEILKKVRCPIIDMIYFDVEDIQKLAPPDRLSLSRSVLVTLNQCINYWVKMSMSEEERLQWSSLSADDLDSLVMLITSDQGQRLSLMPSDLALLRKLPVFETISNDRVSLKDHDEHFILDSSIDITSLNLYLPNSFKNKFIQEKLEMKDLLEDLGVRPMTEAKILEKFVFPQFATMPQIQKESVCETIAEKWDNLRQSREFLEALKETPFVQRTRNDDGGEIEYVKPIQLFDPRNEFLNSIFDGSQNKFPVGNFRTAKWLEILSEIGLNNKIDKEVFLQCAWKVESQRSIEKAIKLHKYFSEHFGEFFDSTQEFNKTISEIQCVPAERDGDPLSLYRFCDIAAPRDRNLIFKVLPVISDDITPPQVMFSSLGIQSPPTISFVLKQIRILTENGGSLYNWSYKYGTIEEVFGNIFSFLQENYDRLSPNVQSGLRERAIVPVGSTLVKASKLFFRLAKDLAPFFFEVPRAFGAYDRLLRELGVRESPQTGDYAISLQELKREIGDGKLNANELNSVVEVLALIADDRSKNGSLNLQATAIFAPDANGVLVPIFNLVQNDRPWLLHANRLDSSMIHIVHPKLSKELCRILRVKMLSERVSEHLEESFQPEMIAMDDPVLAQLQSTMRSHTFKEAFSQLVRKDHDIIKTLEIIPVSTLRTRFIFSSIDGTSGIDISSNPLGTLCFIEKERILVSNTKLPTGLRVELVIAVALCDYFAIDRKNAAGISAMLASNATDIETIGRVLGVGKTNEEDEAHRGEPGSPVTGVDLELLELKPLKVFRKGEIVGIKKHTSSNQIVYGVIVEGGGGNSLSRLRILSGKNKEAVLLSSEIFSLRRGTKSEQRKKDSISKVDMAALGMGKGLVRRLNEAEINDLEPVMGSGSLSENTKPKISHAIDHAEVLAAVQDLLKSSNLSLRDDIEDVLALNLQLQDDSLQKKSHLESLKNEGRELAKNLTKGMDTFLCPITRDLMTDPVICSDGHTYERYAIEEWLRSSSRSPKTNQRLASRELIPNHAMRNTIEGMEETICAVKKFNGAYE